MKKLLYIIIIALTLPVGMVAQSGTNSPYSQYGYGKISDQSTGLSRGMNGVGLAFRERNLVNYMNPASYSGVDSLTFVFDVAMSLQSTNFRENGKSKNANNGDFEYAVASFRVMRHLGMSFGILPYTNIGYNYNMASRNVADEHTANGATNYLGGTTYSAAYSGSGGLHQIYLGAGWEPVRNVSVGMNVSYIFGNMTNSVVTSFSDTYVKSLSGISTTDVRSLKFDFGASYTHEIDAKRSVTVGLTYSPGKKLGADTEFRIIATNTQSAVNDTTLYVARNAIELPTQFGLGLSYKYGSKWLLGMDYTLQKWASVDCVPYVNEATNVVYDYTDSYSNRHKINFGGQYCKNTMGFSFLDRLRYRFGVGYTSSFLKINGHDGPSEFSLSAGIGIPIMNQWNNRSILNVGVQWQHASAKNLITENTFLFNIGITFNENWFSKWKFQ